MVRDGSALRLALCRHDAHSTSVDGPEARPARPATCAARVAACGRAWARCSRRRVARFAGRWVSRRHGDGHPGNRSDRPRRHGHRLPDPGALSALRRRPRHFAASRAPGLRHGLVERRAPIAHAGGPGGDRRRAARVPTSVIRAGRSRFLRAMAWMTISSPLSNSKNGTTVSRRRARVLEPERNAGRASDPLMGFLAAAASRASSASAVTRTATTCIGQPHDQDADDPTPPLPTSCPASASPAHFWSCLAQHWQTA